MFRHALLLLLLACASAQGAEPWVHEHYDLVSVHPQPDSHPADSPWVVFWRDGRPVATRWLHAGYRWQAVAGRFRVEFDDGGVAR